MATGTILTEVINKSDSDRSKRKVLIEWNSYNIDTKLVQKAINAWIDEYNIEYSKIAVDGGYGSGTMNAVKRFQREYSIEETGYCDNNTISKFESLGYNVSFVFDNSSSGSTETTKMIQRSLNSIKDVLGIQELVVDGGYGANTTNAVKAFQAHHGLSQTGTMTDETIDKFEEVGLNIKKCATLIKSTIKAYHDSGSEMSGNVQLNTLVVKFNGTEIHRGSSGNFTPGVYEVRGTDYNVYHDSVGVCEIKVSVTAKLGGDYSTRSYDYSFKADQAPCFGLNISADSGSSVLVTRTYCPGGNYLVGNIAIGKPTIYNNYGIRVLYYNDNIKIQFSSDVNHSITSNTVNGQEFVSGNTHTVSKNVSIKVTSAYIQSVITATDAQIGGLSAISVSKYSDMYTHSIKYTFGDMYGWINEYGASVDHEVKTTEQYISWNATPYSGDFYSQIPNSQTGKCVLTCTTYDGDNIVGAPYNINITLSTDRNICTPEISTITFTDVDEITKLITGNNIFIKGKSDVKYDVSLSSRKYSTISSVSINGAPYSFIEGSNVDVSHIYNDIQFNTFNLSVTDSRGYTVTITNEIELIDYRNLTLNVAISRDSNTSNSVHLKFDGSYFNSNFGSVDNTLSIEATYYNTSDPETTYQVDIRAPGEAGQNYIIIDNSYITTGDGIAISDISYEETYVFTVRASDRISTVENVYTVKRGIPTFDWGKTDFNFNVPFHLKDFVVVSSNQFGGYIVVNDISGQPKVEIGCDSSGGYIKINGQKIG